MVFHQGQVIEEGKVVEKADDFVMIRAREFFTVVDKNQVVKQT